MATKSTELTKSRYVQGGLTDVFKSRLGWWERRTFEKSDTDIRYSIQSNEAGRPDLIAYRVYGDVRLMWIVMQYNTIVDPLEELKSGTVITLPSRDRVNIQILSQQTGGNDVNA